MNTNSKTDKTAQAYQKTAEVIHCEIRDQFGDVESAGTVLTSLEAYHWYENHGANFDCAKMNDSGFTFQRPPEAIECEPQADIEQGATLDALLAKHKPQAGHSRLPWAGTPAEQFLYNELELGIEGSANLRRSQQREIIRRLRKSAHVEALAEALRGMIESPNSLQSRQDAIEILANWEEVQQ